MPYEYVTSLNRYRDSMSKRFVPRARIMEYVDRIMQSGRSASDVLAQLVTERVISPRDFGERMRAELRATYIQQYVLGRGGRELMQPADWGRVGSLLREQYQYLKGFVVDLEHGTLTEGQVRARANLYFQRSREAYEIANAYAYGLPRLPAYPGDLSTECKGGCHCHWEIQKLNEQGDADCYWRIDPQVENCPTCELRGQEWAPLAVRSGVLSPYRTIRAEAHHHLHEDDYEPFVETAQRADAIRQS